MSFSIVARKLTAFSLVCLLTASAPNCRSQESNDQKQRVLEQTGRAFLEAEAKSYVEKFANQHPPINGMEGFGSSAMFAVQLVFAADNYLKADTDKKRFHAVEQGAAAYVAYAYAATPAVGLAVTAVVLVTGIIESNVASSYAEAQLAFYKDMQNTQLRINELQERSSRATAGRFIAAIEETQRVVTNLNDVNKALSLDCRQPPSSFDSLSKCLTLMTQALTVREQQIAAIDNLLRWPDAMIALLASGENKNKTKDPSELAKLTRNQLKTVRDGTANQLLQLQEAYGQFTQNYGQLAVAMISDEALRDPQRLEAVEEVRHQCFVDDTKLSFAAAQVVYQIAAERAALMSTNPKRDRQAKMLGAHATSLLENFEQRRLSCPDVAADITLAKLMDIVRGRLNGLPVP